MSKSIGQALTRVEDKRLLTGQGKYIDDLGTTRDTAHAAILRSSYPHAKIISIDKSEAEKIEGVKAVITGKDIEPHVRPFSVGVTAPVEYYPLAIEKVRYVGEPVAIIVAKNRYVAEDALDKIVVKYEALEPVVDIEKTIEPTAPILHEKVGSNIANNRQFHYGDVEKAFNEADRIIKHKFHFPKYTATPIETYGVIADYDSAHDQYTVHANFHGPFVIQSIMAGSLKVPSNKLRIIVPKDIGGSYGIKAGIFPYIVLCSITSKLVGCPIKWIEDRQEHLSSSASGTDRVSYLEAAVMNDGKVTGLRLKLIDNVGAYIRAPEPACLYRNHSNTTGAYDIRNLEIDAYAVMTNKSPTGLIRGYGGQEHYFALERLMQIIAKELNMDHSEVIKKNLIKTEQFPYTTAAGGIYDSGDYEKAFEMALETGKYQEFLEKQKVAAENGKLLGVGLACIVEPSGSNMGYITIALTPDERARSPKSGCAEAATVSMDPLGSVNVRISTTPSGQGHETVAAQIVSDILGIPRESINVVAELDTSTSAWSIASGSYSSRFASLGSSAVFYAAQKVKAKLLKIAANEFQTEEANLEIVDGNFVVKDNPEKKLSIKRVAGLAHWNPLSLPDGMEPGIYETYYYTAKVAEAPDENDMINSSVTYGFVADMVTVEIDQDTAEVKIIDYVTIHDAGKLLNPLIVDGQIMGGLAHGLGGALYEELAYDDKGQFLTGSFMDYLVPTVTEMPKVTIKHLETPSPLTPLGAKGLGEGNTMSAPVAVSNAVNNALAQYGVSVDQLPLSPNRIWPILEKVKNKVSL
ncbi:xanthine dehydrogenase family protein molybdopterin-binding subunit [Bacillus sp. Marseille-P3661]|uniref:xanthine dehydrogenase family protein molybdopterin-binding subunit n=1 Tax=Bacillus sp. Marseille-P3661 TaxID=1936234 RepID=UPI000C818C8D|nr:xanthine dehydrogenase family protein molybdopterin-binding subunit [Bacillus sp. Marseille-P3661]